MIDATLTDPSAPTADPWVRPTNWARFRAAAAKVARRASAVVLVMAILGIATLWLFRDRLVIVGPFGIAVCWPISDEEFVALWDGLHARIEADDPLGLVIEVRTLPHCALPVESDLPTEVIGGEHHYRATCEAVLGNPDTETAQLRWWISCESNSLMIGERERDMRFFDICNAAEDALLARQHARRWDVVRRLTDQQIVGFYVDPGEGPQSILAPPGAPPHKLGGSWAWAHPRAYLAGLGLRTGDDIRRFIAETPVLPRTDDESWAILRAAGDAWYAARED